MNGGETDWYAALTGPVPSYAPLIEPGRLSEIYGSWYRPRIDAFIGNFAASGEILLTDFQRSRCKPLPPGTPDTARLFYHGGDAGCMITLEKAPGRHRLVSLQPAARIGSQHRILVGRAHQLPNGLHTVIAGTLVDGAADEPLGGIDVAFHDNQFPAARGFYSAGMVNDFILAGFALRVAVSTPEPLTMPTPGWMRELDFGAGPASKLVLDEMAMFLQSDICLTHFRFRGRVESVNPVLGETDFQKPGFPRSDRVLGCRVWKLRTLVVREPDVLLDIYVTDVIAGPDFVPEPGQWIEGVLALTGYCWW